MMKKEAALLVSLSVGMGMASPAVVEAESRTERHWMKGGGREIVFGKEGIQVDLPMPIRIKKGPVTLPIGPLPIEERVIDKAHLAQELKAKGKQPPEQLRGTVVPGSPLQQKREYAPPVETQSRALSIGIRRK